MRNPLLPFDRPKCTGEVDGADCLVLPSMGFYCVSKFALEALAEAYKYELAQGIESVIIEPRAI